MDDHVETERLDNTLNLCSRVCMCGVQCVILCHTRWEHLWESIWANVCIMNHVWLISDTMLCSHHYRTSRGVYVWLCILVCVESAQQWESTAKQDTSVSCSRDCLWDTHINIHTTLRLSRLLSINTLSDIFSDSYIYTRSITSFVCTGNMVRCDWHLKDLFLLDLTIKIFFWCNQI